VYDEEMLQQTRVTESAVMVFKEAIYVACS
jgi:hypothetical protein